VNCGMLDGSVQRVEDDIDMAVWSEMGTRSPAAADAVRARMTKKP